MQYKHLNCSKKQKGLGLVELIIGLAIVLTIVAIVLSKAGTTFSSNRATQSTDLAQVMAGGIKSAYQLRGSYNGLTNAVAINNGMVPDHMVNGTAVNNAWGGTVTIVPADLNGGTDNAFSMTFTTVPQDDCAKFVSGVSPGFEVVVVGTTTVKAFGASGQADPAAVGTACANASNSVIITSL